jgi:hypothetical protein
MSSTAFLSRALCIGTPVSYLHYTERRGGDKLKRAA